MLRTELQQVEQIPIDRLVLHRLEPRKVREPEHIQEILESIKENGFDHSRALKVVPENGHFAIFAGGTRYSAILGHVDMTNQKLHALDIKTKLASLRTAIC